MRVKAVPGSYSQRFFPTAPHDFQCRHDDSTRETECVCSYVVRCHSGRQLPLVQLFLYLLRIQKCKQKNRKMLTKEVKNCFNVTSRVGVYCNSCGGGLVFVCMFRQRRCRWCNPAKCVLFHSPTLPHASPTNMALGFKRFTGTSCCAP